MSNSPRRQERAAMSSPTGASRSRLGHQTIIQDTAPLIERSSIQQQPATPDQSSHTVYERFLGYLNSFRIQTSTASRPSQDQQNPSTNTTDCTSPEQRSDVVTLPVISERSSSNIDIERSSTNEIETTISHTRTQSNSIPVCLICLETLSGDDFASGRAITLGCKCRGDLALRHRDCAVKWAQVKDDGRGGIPICELCKHPVRNLPPVPPRTLMQLDPETGIPLTEEAYAAATAADQPVFPSFGPPSTADLVFDCIRVTWVAMIVSILFFEASLASALWTGLIAGIAYSMMVRVMYRQHFEAVLAYREQQQAALRSQQQHPPVFGVPMVSNNTTLPGTTS